MITKLSLSAFKKNAIEDNLQWAYLNFKLSQILICLTSNLKNYY